MKFNIKFFKVVLRKNMETKNMKITLIFGMTTLKVIYGNLLVSIHFFDDQRKNLHKLESVQRK